MRELNDGSVWAEFVKIAKDTGLITSDLTPRTHDYFDYSKPPLTGDGYARSILTEEYNNLEKSQREGKETIEEAHPETIQVADAMGMGGVVENEVQAQEHDIQVATRMPTGVPFGAHANLIQGLVKLANELEDRGQFKEAKRVDDTIKEIRRPFANGYLYKEAFWNLAIPIIGAVAGPVLTWLGSGGKEERVWDNKREKYVRSKTPVRKNMGRLGGISTLLSALALFGDKLTSIQENLPTDMDDLKEVLDKANTSASQMTSQILSDFIVEFSQADLGTEEGVKSYIKTFNKLRAVKPKIESGVAKTLLEIGQQNRLFLGMDLPARLEEKLNTFNSTFTDTSDLLNKITTTGMKLNEAGKELQQAGDNAETSGNSDVAKLQTLLFTKGYKGKTWTGEVNGELDETTIQAVRELEGQLTTDLTTAGITSSTGDPPDFSGKVINTNGLAMEPSVLEQIVNKAESLT